MITEFLARRTDRSNNSAGGRIMGSTSMHGQSSEAAFLGDGIAVLSDHYDEMWWMNAEKGFERSKKPGGMAPII